MTRAAAGSRVLIVLDASMAWSRGVLRGFTGAAREHGWRLLHYHPLTDLTWLLDVWQPGVVVLQASLVGEVPALGRSTVISVNDDSTARGIPSVCLDEAAIGALAARHLLARGLRHLTTFRFNAGPFAIAREQSFQETAAAANATLAPAWTHPDEIPAALVAWLSELPNPTGVFAITDSWARVVARYAEVANVRVPEDLALLGVDNDTVDCELAAPPLSSVAIPWREMGEAAAALVERALAGRSVAGERAVVAPVDVIARRSTDVLAIDDPLVATTVAWIAQHATRHLTLNDVARAASCSRQRLEQRFRTAIGRSVMQEVRRARVDAARHLLASTELTLDRVAHQSGFADAATLSVAFRRQTGMPPGAYRQRHRDLDSGRSDD